MGAPVQFGEANFVLGPPGGYEDAVVPLPVLRKIGGQLISCWSLTPEEIDEIVRTKRVWLSVWGGLTQPPVFVTGHKLDALAPET